MGRFFASGKWIAAGLTLAVAAVIGYFAWSGFKAPPVAKPAEIVTTPPGWAKLDAGAFSFYAPAGATLRKAKKGGLEYGDVIGTPMCIRFVAGREAALVVNGKTHPEFTEEAIVAGGRPATLRKAYLKENEQQYWFPNCGAPIYLGLEVPGALPGGEPLVIEISVASQSSADDAVLLFKSVRFQD